CSMDVKHSTDSVYFMLSIPGRPRISAMLKEIPGCVKENHTTFRIPTQTPCPMDDLRLLESCLASNHPRE
ncbi:hypothetical protein KI387_033461, partial [Taxus chinensis]